MPTPTAIDTPSATSWTTGALTFQGVPLSQAVAELNRYSHDKIILGPGVPADRAVTGVFSTGDKDDFVAAVSSVFDLKSVRKANGDLELQPGVRTSG
jgi:transmembrane sensor